MCQKIPLKDYLLKPSFLSGKVHGQWGASKNRWIWSGLEWILDCLLLDLDINYFKNKKTVRTLMTALKWSLYKRRIWKTTKYFFSKRHTMKAQHWIEVCCEVQILSLNRPRSSWGGKRDFKSQSRKGNKTLTKEEKRKSRIFFSLPPRYMAWRPPALFFSRGFMTESF